MLYCFISSHAYQVYLISACAAKNECAARQLVLHHIRNLTQFIHIISCYNGCQERYPILFLCLGQNISHRISGLFALELLYFLLSFL